MGDWKRSTRDCLYEVLPPPLSAAINKHVEHYGLDINPSEILMCVETTSEKVKKGFLEGRSKAVVTCAFVSAGWLVWAIQGESPEVAVMSARLADVVVQDYGATKFAKMVPDSGIEVSGLFTDAPVRGSAFIGLEEGPVSKKFKDSVLKAMQQANK